VVDLSGYMDDVLYVLELANLQLEEYRMMDQRLDRYLDRAYNDLKRRRFGLFGTYSATLGTLRLFRVDVTKLNDEVTHISKFFGDWYLARVYLGALERFYLNQWRQSVENRLGQLDQLYSVVNADINNRRMVLLEVLVVIFFAIDLLWIIFFTR
jgi:thymidylate synthase